MSTIADGDVSANEVTDGSLSMDGATDAFFARYEDASDDTKKKPSEGTTEVEETSDEDTATDDTKKSDDKSTDESPEGEEKDEGAEKPKKFAEDDDTYVKVKVGDKDHEVSVKDLKRMWGQEAALTHKSQEVAEARKKADADTAKAVAGLNVLLQRAQEKANPFKQIDFLVAAKELSAEELTLLRTEATRAFEEEKFLTTELNGFMTAVQEKQSTELKARAVECVKSLKDQASPSFIDGWNDNVYNEIRQFAVSQGIPEKDVNGLADAPVIKLLHMAMQFSRGQSKVQTTKVNKTPKTIIKNSQTPVSHPSSKTKATKAFNKLEAAQTVDAAADAFLSRMNAENDD